MSTLLHKMGASTREQARRLLAQPQAFSHLNERPSNRPVVSVTHTRLGSASFIDSLRGV
jgi:hypothetical protein